MEVKLKLLYAEGLQNKELLGKQDPYVILKCGERKMTGKVVKNGGESPQFNQEFTFNVLKESDIQVKIMDKDMFFDDVIGTATVSLTKALSEGEDAQKVAILCQDGNNRGFLHLTVSVPDVQRAAPQQQFHQPHAYYQPQPHLAAMSAVPAAPWQQSPHLGPAHAASFPPPSQLAPYLPYPQYPMQPAVPAGFAGNYPQL